MNHDPKGFIPFAKTSGYDPQSCNALSKPFYRPIEAAIRWCGLIEEEPRILAAVGNFLIPPPHLFPEYRCLTLNTERIVHALNNDDIPKSRDGTRVGKGEHVAPARLTIAHGDLKKWMAEYYPDQKPPFLFDEIERKAHAAINADSFLALQADRDAARIELKQAAAWADETIKEINALKLERDALLAKAKALGTTERTTLLTIIAGICHHARIDHQAHGAAARISRMIEKTGATVSSDTLERVLPLIPDAVESRTK